MKIGLALFEKLQRANERIIQQTRMTIIPPAWGNCTNNSAYGAFIVTIIAIVDLVHMMKAERSPPFGPSQPCGSVV